MPAQPTDTPTDTAALEQELAELRKSQVPPKLLAKFWPVVAVVLLIFAVVIWISVDVDIIGKWMGILLLVIAPLLGRSMWRDAYAKYRIKHIELLLNSAPPLQTRLIQKNNTLFKLRRISAILFVIYNVAGAVNLLAISFGHFAFDGWEIVIAIVLLSTSAFFGVMKLIARLEKQMASIEATAEWREREKQQSRAKEQ